jgi:hypothetical protein
VTKRVVIVGPAWEIDAKPGASAFVRLPSTKKRLIASGSGIVTLAGNEPGRMCRLISTDEDNVDKKQEAQMGKPT